MRLSRCLWVAVGSALSALLVSPVAAADEPILDPEVEVVDDLELVSAGTLRDNTERRPAVVVGVKTYRADRTPQMIGVFLFSRRPVLAPNQPRFAAPIRIAPARQNGIWVLIAEGRF